MTMDEARGSGIGSPYGINSALIESTGFSTEKAADFTKYVQNQL